jgi:hypothetical protein
MGGILFINPKHQWIAFALPLFKGELEEVTFHRWQLGYKHPTYPPLNKGEGLYLFTPNSIVSLSVPPF